MGMAGAALSWAPTGPGTSSATNNKTGRQFIGRLTFSWSSKSARASRRGQASALLEDDVPVDEKRVGFELSRRGQNLADRRIPAPAQLGENVVLLVERLVRKIHLGYQAVFAPQNIEVDMWGANAARVDRVDGVGAGL